MNTIDITKMRVKVNRPKVAAATVAVVAVMLLGYVAITALVSWTGRELDTFSIQRVQTHNLLQPVRVQVPVVQAMDVESQVSQAIAKSLGK